MDPISTALTSAWLSAVHRARSPAYQHFVQQVPEAKPPRAGRTLSDVIESALQDAGVKPAKKSAEPATDTKSEARTSTHQVDRLV